MGLMDVYEGGRGIVSVKGLHRISIQQEGGLEEAIH